MKLPVVLSSLLLAATSGLQKAIAYHSTQLPVRKDSMKTTTPIAFLLLTVVGATAVHADHPYRYDHLGFSLHAGSFELEGPAVTADPNGVDQDVDLFVLRFEGHKLLRDTWYARGVADFSRLDGDAGLVQANVSIGTIRALTAWDAWKLDGYLQAGVEYMRSSDLDKLASKPEFGGTGTGAPGDDFGPTAEIGLSLGFRPESRVDVFAKYLAVGDGGVSFGVRVSHDLNETWTATGGLEAIWVDDPGIKVNLDYQRFTLGLLRKF
jgi:hypothetical protein